MSGFAAILGRIEPEALVRVVAAGRHRGTPEIWTAEAATLVSFRHRGGALTHKGPFHLSFDGRLDERLALAGSLGTRLTHDAPRAFEDAGLVLSAWEKWRERGLKRVRGDFAFALFDERDHSLVLGRDRVGIYPAFWAQARDHIMAASEPGMLLADPAVPGEIDEDWVARFIAGEGRFGVSTPYRAIRRVLGGTVVRVTANRARTHTWYRLGEAGRVRERSDGAYAERFRGVLEEAVRCRLHDAGRIAVMLSGGLDSTTILCLLARAGADVVAISLPFAYEGADERAYAEIAARHAGVSHVWADPSRYSAFGEGDRALYEQGGIFSPPNTWMGWVSLDRARAMGIDVAVDGIDADSMVGGGPLFLADLALTGRIRSLRRETKALAAPGGVSAMWLRSVAYRAAIPPSARALYRRIRHHSRGPAWAGPRLSRAVEEILADEQWRPWRMYKAGESEALSPGLLDPVLETAGHYAAHRGQVLLHPFLDSRLVDFCIGLPREQKIRNGWQKVVMRNALVGVLPEEIRLRGKADLSLAFRAAVRDAGGDDLRAGLAGEQLADLGWVRRDALAWDGTDGRLDDLSVWRIAMLNHWLRWLDRREVIYSMERKPSTWADEEVMEHVRRPDLAQT